MYKHVMDQHPETDKHKSIEPDEILYRKRCKNAHNTCKQYIPYKETENAFKTFATESDPHFNEEITWTILRAATPPGTILGYKLQERKISTKDFADMAGIQKELLDEIIKGKSPITENVADKIEQTLGIPPLSLFELQLMYDHAIQVAKSCMVVQPHPLHE